MDKTAEVIVADEVDVPRAIQRYAHTSSRDSRKENMRSVLLRVDMLREVTQGTNFV